MIRDMIWATVRNQRGAVIALVAVCMAVMLGVGGLALDAGRGYLMRAEFARAVDAGALAGARTLRQGEVKARQRALDIAALNGLAEGQQGVSLGVTFGTNEFGEKTIELEARRRFPTLLMSVMGFDSMTVASRARAAIPPVDLVLVLDQSGSLIDLHAWDDLQDAAKDFVEHFDDDIDKLGLASFQIRGTERVFLRHGFQSVIDHQIDHQIEPGGDTNIGEGLRHALEQLTSDEARDRSAKVVVFFTDGRGTAFRGNIAGQDRTMAVYRGSSNTIRGLWNDPDDLPTDDPAMNPDYCEGQGTCAGFDADDVREESAQTGLDVASAIRSEGIYVYSIGMGDPGATDPLEVPDLDYLREIANEDGTVDGDQPQGKSYFAPSANELEAVFNQVAQDLLVRLAQ